MDLKAELPMDLKAEFLALLDSLQVPYEIQETPLWLARVWPRIKKGELIVVTPHDGPTVIVLIAEDKLL